MNGVGALLQGWLASAERLAARLPELAAFLRQGSWPGAAVAAGAGIFLLVAGIRLPRVVTAIGGGAVGALAGLAYAEVFRQLGVSPSTAALGCGAALAIACALAPPLFPVVLGAVPGALVGARAQVTENPALGAAAGALVLGVFGYLLRRFLVAVAGALAGALLVAAALLALSARFPALGELARRPVVLAAGVALLAVAGAAYQLGAASAPRRAPVRRDPTLRE
jgi:hypothetical protein